MFLKSIKIILVAVITLGLAGCDDLRSKVAELIQSETPQQKLSSVENLIAAGKLASAISKAEKFAEEPGPLQGQFAWNVARAYALDGDVDRALKYLQIAIEKLGLDPAYVLHENAFASMQTNIRFMQTITNIAGSKQNQNSIPSRTEPQVNESQSSIKMDGSGTEVRAGNIVLKLPN